MSDAELEALWDFDDPAGSEKRFRALVERAKATGDPILAEALTQLARAQGLQRRFADADRSLDEAEAALRPDDGRWCVARCLRSLGRTEEALAEQRALAAELEAIGESDEFVTQEIAECLRALGRA